MAKLGKTYECFCCKSKSSNVFNVSKTVGIPVYICAKCVPGRTAMLKSAPCALCGAKPAYRDTGVSMRYLCPQCSEDKNLKSS